MYFIIKICAYSMCSINVTTGTTTTKASTYNPLCGCTCIR